VKLAARSSWLAALLLLPGCSSDGASAPEPPDQPDRPIRPPEIGARKSSLAFSAPTLDGWTFDLAERNARRRIVVCLFDPAAAASNETTRVAQRLHAERHAYNLEVVGVAVPPGYTPLSARRIPKQRPSAQELATLARNHLAKHGADFPCVVDPDAKIVEAYTLAWGIARLDEIPAFYPFAQNATDTARPIFRRYAEKAPDPADYLHRRVLRRFEIEPTTDADPLAGHFPPAPQFAATDSAGKPHALRDYAGRLLVIVFIARDCPRCKDLLIFLSQTFRELGPSARRQPPWLEVLVVATDTTGDALKALAAERPLPFPIAGDPDWTLRGAFRYRGAVPDTFVIAPDATIRFRHHGFTTATPALLHMEITTLLGLPTEPLLERVAFSSDEACRICHPREYADWTLTRHACAWESLVRLGKESDPSCAKCHVVGAHQVGGFISHQRTPQLTNVQCESCHGQNGCPAFTKAMSGGATREPPTPPRVPEHRTPNTEHPVPPAACAPCHDAVHSPRFDFAAYRARVLHNRAEELSKLPRAEREARLRRLCAGARDDLFDPNTPYVGSAACAKCHPTEFDALKDGFHAKALKLLEKPAPDNWSVPRHKRGVVGLTRPDCLRCHVTGYGRPGGYPAVSPSPSPEGPHPSPLPKGEGDRRAPPRTSPSSPLPPGEGRVRVPDGRPAPPRTSPPSPLPPGEGRVRVPDGRPAPLGQSEMQGVGCEACHGPGDAHVKDPKKPRAILHLGGTCPECNVLPLCRACHDDANSPDFDPRTALPKARHPTAKATAP
jgi:peroxiredoxin